MLQYLLTAALAYVVWTLLCLELNVRKARDMKVPYVRIPIDSNNIPWTIIQPLVYNLLDRLPIKWSSYPDFVRYSRRGWAFADKAQATMRLGPVWALVTPVGVYLHVSDPGAIQEILTRRKDFPRPYKELQLLEVYGPCISTAGWEDWPRHRKVLASPFNESIMKFVWSESISQARAMLRYWTNLSSAGIPSVQRDIRTVSLNVLAAIAFRRSYNFRGSSEPSVDDTNSYRDALQTVLDGAIPLLLIPYKILASSWLPLPKGLARLGKAAVAYKKHMMTMLEEELAALNQGTHGSGGVMTAFVRALDVHNRETAAGSPPPAREDRKGLSVDEILGNLFVLNFAGHDTTANTLAFATLLLAAHPEVQDWLREEVRSVTKDSTTPEKWDYKTMYPQLKRCHAVFLETLRLYPPVMIIPKTVTQPQTLEVGKRTLTIPPPTGVSVSAMAVQTNPDFWGPDPLAWKPARWILNPAPADSSPPSQGQLAGEELLVPERNTFLAWSEGPQSCPGRKFSEVEATAVIASLFEGHRLTVKREAGESDDDARKRAVECVNDVNMEMLLKMVDADRVKLVCSRVD